jgi:hypothetical protein
MVPGQRRDLDQSQPLDKSLIERFKSHVIHPVLAEVGKMRPAVDISIGGWTPAGGDGAHGDSSSSEGCSYTNTLISPARVSA